MVSPQFRPLIGGYESAAECLATGLGEAGHEVTVLAERRGSSWPRTESTGTFYVKRWPLVYIPHFHTATSVLGLLAWLIAYGRKADVWHIHQYGLLAGVTIAMSKLLNKPTVLKLTSSGSAGLATVFAPTLLGRLLKLLHRRVDAVVALTDETAHEAKLFGIPADRIRLLGNPVNTSVFRSVVSGDRDRAKRTLGLETGRAAVSVGRLSREKNLRLMLDAWAIAVDRTSEPWMLIVVGDGPERTALERYAASVGVTDSVRFVGLCPSGGMVHCWLSASDLFLQSSNFEGLSNTTLEALATGLPVVCTDVSGAHECVREPDTGLVVPVGDSTALADAIVELANDDARRAQMSKRAVALIRNRYSLEHVVEVHEQLYKSLIEDRHARPAA